MARDSRSKSPLRRDRPRYAFDERHGSGEPGRDRTSKYRDEEDERDRRNDRYRRRRSDYEDEDRRVPVHQERNRIRESDSGYEGRRRKDGHDNGRYRHRDMGDRDREHDRGPKPSTSRRSPGPRSRSPSRSRQKSPSPEKDKDKGKPNFNQSGLLAAATNMVRHADGTSTVLKYNEPAEARKPPVGWRLYVFKGKEQTDLLHIHRQSCYLIGRDKAVVDIYIEHPSCSKQHAVIQYRQVQQKDDFGSSKAVVKPFIIDLESTNGTHVNDEAIPVSRYYELKMGDIIKFGQSTREYVLLHDDA